MSNRVKKEVGHYCGKVKVKSKAVEKLIVDCKSQCELKMEKTNSFLMQVRQTVGAYKDVPLVIELKIPSEYPFKAPEVIFRTPIFHPHVDNQENSKAEYEGQVCKDLIGGEWGPAKKIVNVVQTVLSMIKFPSLEAAVNSKAADLLKAHDLKQIREECKKLTTKHSAQIKRAMTVFEMSATMETAFLNATK